MHAWPCLLLQTPTNMLECPPGCCAQTPTNMWGLDARCWNFTDEREYGLWISKARWHTLLAQAGFTRVTEHWCAPDGCQSSAVACRFAAAQTLHALMSSR
jgi:hypothetical protein